MGWDKRRVVTYLDRGQFPEPLTSLASGRIWLREDVEAFAEEWRRAPSASRWSRRRMSRVLYLIRHGRSDFDSVGDVRDGTRRPVGSAVVRGGAAPGRAARGAPAADGAGRRRRLLLAAPPGARDRRAYADAAGIDVVFDDDLIEAHIGGWEGLPFEEIVASDAELVHRIRNQQADLEPRPGRRERGGLPGSRRDGASRRSWPSTPMGDVVVVAHGGVINAYCGEVLGLPTRCSSCPRTRRSTAWSSTATGGRCGS